MKHNTDKYNVAWYRLSECVAKGERERALGMYRLLAHSIDNQALVKQLEGDILYLFHDEMAFERYKEAAHLYRERGHYLQALALLEQVVQTPCATLKDRVTLIELYGKTGAEDRAENYALQVQEDLIKRGSIAETIQLLSLICAHSKSILVPGIMRLSCEDLVMVDNKHLLPHLIGLAVEHILAHSDTHALDRFVQHVRAHNTYLSDIAREYLDNPKLK